MSAFRAPHILIFEPDARGHACEWLEHLLEFCRSGSTPITLSLAVPPELMRRIAAWPERVGALTIRRFPLTAQETDRCLHSILAVSGFARWWTMRRYLIRSGAHQGVFLSIDHASLPLACSLGFRGRPVSGILFRPSVHYRELDDHRPNWRERLRDFRKAVLYRGMLRNPAVRSVLTLDPYFPHHARVRYRNGNKVEPLPDPVNPVVPISWADTKIANLMPPSRVKFVLFGDLTERKGVLVLLEALARLDPTTAASIAVMIAGRSTPSFHTAIAGRVGKLAETKAALWLHYENRFLERGELAALVSRSDVVLAPYQRFVGSSGVLMWAAREGKPVITQDYGLLGRLTREYRLGLALNTTDPAALCDSIERAAATGPRNLADVAKMAAFVSRRTPDRFASALVNSAAAPPYNGLAYGRSLNAASTVPK